ncbi:hypothetical protein [Bradyrhizobium neotropicale]|uniref:hypothetical protein n=1 Tax=Bradyrhizobium neotropicale TaxID=1497615 RepID=UPI001AD69CF0|nr:hypothetical protein [Bradyrhizobium neotropicale]MBO4221932.1 hypothetical protein [Bradyrhizobium neotropicale]
MTDEDIRQEVIDGILMGARETSANLFKVANGGEHGCRDRARVGITKVKETTAMMLALVDEVFGESVTGEMMIHRSDSREQS